VNEGPPTAGGWKRRIPGSSLGIGLATILVTVPLILVVPKPMAWLVAFIVLCVYPVLDAPRNVARRSWWLGAALSTVVWFVGMIALVATADARERMREGAMVSARSEGPGGLRLSRRRGPGGVRQHLDRSEMSGEFSNERGFREPWTARRMGGLCEVRQRGVRPRPS
jgi:hypothetical protein